MNNCILSREYRTIKEYKINWVRPKPIPFVSPERSGDLGLKIDVKSADLGKEYNDLPELQDAPDLVKRMFTLRFLPRKETVYMRREKVLELVKRHKLDRKSLEAKIAIMTNDIFQLQEFLTKTNPKHTGMKSTLNILMGKRKKMLKLLREWDYRRFEWVLEKLNLTYTPIPEFPHQITRKESLTRLTEKHCNKLVQEKLDIYKKELKDLQKDFYMEKAEKLAFIREEELACGLQPSVSEEEIVCAKEKASKYET